MDMKKLFHDYSNGVAHVVIKDAKGDLANGTAFHIGENVFITARHVVEHGTIDSVILTRDRLLKVVRGPFFHPNADIDVAAFVTEETDAIALPLGSHLDDWIADDDFMLRKVLVLGYPPIPLFKPTLVAATAEINAVADMYKPGGHPHFILSMMARGGFSGGPAIVEHDFVLGLVTDSLVRNGEPEQIGFCSVISTEPILVCLDHNKIMPDVLKPQWDEIEPDNVWGEDE